MLQLTLCLNYSNPYSIPVVGDSSGSGADDSTFGFDDTYFDDTYFDTGDDGT